MRLRDSAFALALPAVVAAALAREPAPQLESLGLRPVRGVFGHLIEGEFLEPTGVFYDRERGELYICDTGRRRIAIADERGFPTFSFGSEATLVAPRGLAVDRQGRILVADAVHPAVRVFDYDGTALADIELAGAPPADHPIRPNALALDAEGTLFVLDSANRRILRTTVDGAPSSAVRPIGGRPDLLVAPVDIDLTPEGHLAVADASGLPVQIYDRAGKLLRGWGEFDVGIGGFSLPSGIAVDGAGRVWVADTLRQDIKGFAPDGRFLVNFGGWGTAPGQVLYPVDVASDGAGRLFVTERIGRRVQVFEIFERSSPGLRLSTQPGR